MSSLSTYNYELCTFRLRDLDREQTESLIGINNGNHSNRTPDSWQVIKAVQKQSSWRPTFHGIILCCQRQIYAPVWHYIQWNSKHAYGLCVVPENLLCTVMWAGGKLQEGRERVCSALQASTLFIRLLTYITLHQHLTQWSRFFA